MYIKEGDAKGHPITDINDAGSDEDITYEEMESVMEALTHPISQQPEDEASVQCSWNGFKIVGDNIDKTVHASFQRSNDLTQRSLHHFHAFAVRDRIDFSDLSDSQPLHAM